MNMQTTKVTERGTYEIILRAEINQPYYFVAGTRKANETAFLILYFEILWNANRRTTGKTKLWQDFPNPLFPHPQTRAITKHIGSE
jgi:hypothetical protein